MAGVIAGLLAMHTLNLHGTPAAHTAAFIPVAHAEQAPDVSVGAHQSDGTADESGGTCADCGTGDHLGMAMACVLALLLFLLILAPPRLLPGWMHTTFESILRARTAHQVFARAPSLYVLCISRT